MPATAETKLELPRRPRAESVDRHVGARLRERRLCLGLSQQEVAELIGVTYQQAHKYEKGINRVASGRLYVIAQALGVEVSYFFDGIPTDAKVVGPAPKQRMLLELCRSFSRLADRRQQDAICGLARTLANPASQSETQS